MIKKSHLDNNKNPLVSIIIPVFNTEKYLAECLESVIIQTYKNIEIICINDGSLDNSQNILEKYAEIDKRILVINQSNQGVVCARNNAIKKSNGEYIYPLDSDDKIAPTCIEKLIHKILNSNYSAVGCDVEIFGEIEYINDIKEIKQNPTKFNMYLLQNCCLVSAMYPKNLWIKYGGYDESFNRDCEDLDFWLNFIDDNKKIFILRETLFYYRQKSVDESRHLLALPYKKQSIALLRKKHKKMYLYQYLNKIIKSIFEIKKNKINKIRFKIFKITVWTKNIY